MEGHDQHKFSGALRRVGASLLSRRTGPHFQIRSGATVADQLFKSCYALYGVFKRQNLLLGLIDISPSDLRSIVYAILS